MTDTVVWLDCSAGVSGDMLLGALQAVDAVDVPAVAAALGVDVSVDVSVVRRAGLAAHRVDVRPAEQQPHRRLADVVGVIESAGLDREVGQQAVAVFERLAAAEASVHGVDVQEIEFHEVGAVDAIVDVVGCCVGLRALDATAVIASPIALGGGTVSTRHGTLPVPVPAVLALLAGTDLTGFGGPAQFELATPTGVAVLATFATASGPMPALSVTEVGVGAGARDLTERPNVLRLVRGSLPVAGGSTGWQLLEANVDDLDPRLWPGVLERLLAAGAADAWLAPIVMKKGRPAHTLVVLARDDVADAVAATAFTETSTIGLRTTPVGKRELDRQWLDVDVDGQPVRVKVARLAGSIVNVSPEFDDVTRAAAALNRPVKVVLGAAAAAAHALLS